MRLKTIILILIIAFFQKPIFANEPSVIQNCDTLDYYPIYFEMPKFPDYLLDTTSIDEYSNIPLNDASEDTIYVMRFIEIKKSNECFSILFNMNNFHQESKYVQVLKAKKSPSLISWFNIGGRDSIYTCDTSAGNIAKLLFDFHFNILRAYLSNKDSLCVYFSPDFFEKTTCIKSQPGLINCSERFFWRAPSEHDYQNWYEWYLANKDKIYYDKKEDRFLIRD